jgi:hypothetical protein
MSGQHTKQNPYVEKDIFGFIKHNIIKAVAYYNLDVTIITCYKKSITGKSSKSS